MAINVAMEAPELVHKVIADSFEGETSLKAFTENVKADREASKHDDDARMFYEYMHGPDWEQVVDNDTDAIIRHDRGIGRSVSYTHLAAVRCFLIYCVQISLTLSKIILIVKNK